MVTTIVIILAVVAIIVIGLRHAKKKLNKHLTQEPMLTFAESMRAYTDTLCCGLDCCDKISCGCNNGQCCHKVKEEVEIVEPTIEPKIEVMLPPIIDQKKTAEIKLRPKKQLPKKGAKKPGRPAQGSKTKPKKSN